MVTLFSQEQIEAIAGALGDTDVGLKGSEIALLIAACEMTDPGEITKRHRIYNAFVTSQNARQDRTRILGFIRKAMSPARYSREPYRYEPMRANLNQALAFAGLVVSEAGKIETVEQATTLPEAQRRARELRTDLETRGVHPDVLRFCRAELLADDYFHAVQEAVKSVADKMRVRTGLRDPFGVLRLDGFGLRLRRPQHSGKPALPDKTLLGGFGHFRLLLVRNTAGRILRYPFGNGLKDITRPTNVASNKPYRGINTVSLWATAYACGYARGVWGTYRQWQALGAQVRKGECASLGVLWKEVRHRDDEDRDDDGTDRHLFARAFSLFNADQVEGYAPEPGPVLPESERLAVAEQFITALNIDTVYGSASAYYHIAEDRIHMPDFSAFHDAHGFYATHIHECAHASGAAHRLDRDFRVQWTRHTLAMEEATAELTASFLLADLGIAHEPRPDHAAYIASWLQLLKDEPRASRRRLDAWPAAMSGVCFSGSSQFICPKYDGLFRTIASTQPEGSAA